MTLTEEQTQSAATALLEADRSGQQIGLLSQQYPDLDMDDGYAIQAALIRMKQQSGRHIIGRKIGLTSKAMQAALNIDTPDSGVLLDDMLFENETKIPVGRFIQPRIEAEIAFVMKHAVAGTTITRDTVIAATDCVVPALEILDTRILRRDPNTGKTRKIVDTIADNAANAGIVLGTEKHRYDAFDLRWVGAIVSKDNEVEETGLGAGVLNDPATSVVWLANRLRQYGDSIEAGDIILSGSFIRPIEATTGATIHADFGKFGSVTCSF
ncbi:MAG: 2-oxo-hepta-3-ene-1,7-dioic acid hydratase [Burkholderiaceae bacterium]